MAVLGKGQAAEALVAEMGAALAARRATLEFERRFAALDRREQLGREIFEARVAEQALAKSQETHEGLDRLSEQAAASLEAEALTLFPLLDSERDAGERGVLRLVCAAMHLARLAEARTRAFFTAARQGHRLPGFDDAVELAAENEQLFTSLRRFESLLERKSAWELHDLAWLRLRVNSVPGRLRLRAAALRSLAVCALERPLPATWIQAVAPFKTLEISEASALAWNAAGFTAEEAVDWREAGQMRPAHAHAWHSHGFSPQEAGSWAKAGLLPDESGIYVHCGAVTLETALALHKGLGDVERLLPWFRAGYTADEVLSLRGEGVKTPDQALAQGRPAASHGHPAAPVLAVPQEAQIAPAASEGDGTAPAANAAGASKAPVGIPGIVLGSGIQSAPVDPALSQSWIARRARERLGLDTKEDEEAWTAVPPGGGAWMGWGVIEPGVAGGSGDPPAVRLPLGSAVIDIACASESVALPGKPAQPTSREPEESWQAAVDALRVQHHLPQKPGHWHLFAWMPQRAVLSWSLVLPGAAPPWAEAVDYDREESWLHRWARKTEEWGEEGAEAPCRVGRTSEGGWWIGLRNATYEVRPGELKAVDPVWRQIAWKALFEDFCLKMEMPLQTAQWNLVSLPAEGA